MERFGDLTIYGRDLVARPLVPKYEALPMFDGDFDSLMIQVFKACQVENLDYIVHEHYIEIKYRSIDTELQMKIISGLILCGFRHLDVAAGNVRVYFDKVIAMIIHWS